MIQHRWGQNREADWVAKSRDGNAFNAAAPKEALLIMIFFLSPVFLLFVHRAQMEKIRISIRCFVLAVLTDDWLEGLAKGKHTVDVVVAVKYVLNYHSAAGALRRKFRQICWWRREARKIFMAHALLQINTPHPRANWKLLSSRGEEGMCIWWWSNRRVSARKKWIQNDLCCFIQMKSLGF